MVLAVFEAARRLLARAALTALVLLSTTLSVVLATASTTLAGEISHWPEYQYVLVNRDTAECLGEVRAIVAAERLKRGRQIGMVPFVRDLVAGG